MIIHGFYRTIVVIIFSFLLIGMKSDALFAQEQIIVSAEDGTPIISIPLHVSFLDEQNMELFSQSSQKTKKPSVQKNTTIITVTAYSSTLTQTDSTPCVTASGFNVCEHNTENIIAANFLPFGTRVRFLGHFDGRIFIVQDRMHRRHAKRVDVWMKSKQSAKKFGIKRLTMEIVPETLAGNF